MKEKEAKEYAEQKFKSLTEIEQKWNYIHSKYLIQALNELSPNIKEEIIALAWVHDIGKIEGDENHAEKSIKILEKDFQLTQTDKDCILEHGSGGNPITNEGKIFRNADGLSLFYPETVIFRFWGEGKEGKSFEEIKETIKKAYEKYIKAYQDNPKAVQILKEKYKILNLN